MIYILVALFFLFNIGRYTFYLTDEFSVYYSIMLVFNIVALTIAATYIFKNKESKNKPEN